MTDMGGKASPLCPACGGTFTVEQTFKEQAVVAGYQFQGEPLARRQVLCLVAFCDGCEFVHEFNTAPSKGVAA